MKKRQVLGAALAAMLTLTNGASLILAEEFEDVTSNQTNSENGEVKSSTGNDDSDPSGTPNKLPESLLSFDPTNASHDKVKEILSDLGIKYSITYFNYGEEPRTTDSQLVGDSFTFEVIDGKSTDVRVASLNIQIQAQIDDNYIPYNYISASIDYGNIVSFPFQFDEEKETWEFTSQAQYIPREKEIFAGPKISSLPKLKVYSKSETTNKPYNLDFQNVKIDCDRCSFTEMPESGVPEVVSLTGNIQTKLITDALEGIINKKVTLNKFKWQYYNPGKTADEAAAGGPLYSLNGNNLHGGFTYDSEKKLFSLGRQLVNNSYEYVIQFSEGGGITPSKPSNPNTPSTPAKPTDTAPKFDTTKHSENYRLYNPNTGEHFYTTSAAERDHLTAAGWNNEKVEWISMKQSSEPVYRVYNPNSGDHHYTKDVHEKDVLVGLGWKDEGISMYANDTGKNIVEVYRLYNPNAKTGNHHYTTNKAEYDHLISLGWNGEGLAWNGLKVKQ
ncbi:hypothetical protein [Allobaculum sp. JKK-2023]|uniref:hypothetical protein n=1 Tax=Allobaculum sp. JKK-2023 TaxID=3108943 RepID=UPI002B053D7E|nr:hypothetical protein [Allobaculum sp. JKK-2023]